MTPLHRAIALVQMNDVAVAIAKHLDFNVAGPLHVLLDQHRIVAKTAARLTLARRQSLVKICRLLDDAHALAATACAGFDQHREPDGFGFLRQQGRCLVRAVVARHQGHTGFFHQLLGRCLQAHGLDGRRGRPDEHHTRLFAGIGEVGVLAQKTIARMDGLRPRLHGGLQDALPLQITVLRGVAADVHRFITGLHMGRLCVGIRVHGHGAHTQATGTGGHAAGDFAAVGDEDFVKHHVSSAWPLLPASPRWRPRQWPAHGRHATSARWALHACNPCRPRTADSHPPPR